MRSLWPPNPSCASTPSAVSHHTAFNSAPQRELRRQLIHKLQAQHGCFALWAKEVLFSVLRAEPLIARFLDSDASAALKAEASPWLWANGVSILVCVDLCGDAVVGQLVRLVVMEAATLGT